MGTMTKWPVQKQNITKHGVTKTQQTLRNNYVCVFRFILFFFLLFSIFNYLLLLKVILPLNESIKPYTLVFINLQLNQKFILINDKLQYDLDLISSKHWGVTGYTFANI